MKDDDPFNYPAQSHKRLLEIRDKLSEIAWVLEILCLCVVIWFIRSMWGK